MKNISKTENNKLIAEFMRLTIITDNISYFDTNYKALKNYHSDWNWLMEVVEKIYNTIESITDEQNSEWDILTRNIRDNFYFPKIEAVYNACIEFIKWYNQQKQ